MVEMKDGKKILTTPVSDEDLADINIGDIIYLNGSLTTCRDVAHRRLVEYGRELPVDVRNNAIFHAGPIIRPLEDDKFEMVSVGPTTSMRMEKFEKEFVEKTGVDCLAVAFGTTHGVYLTEPKLDLPRVAEIRDAAGVPLVMHGGSGVSDEDYRVAIENGICKVNYYTYMNTAGGKASKEYWEDESKPLFYDSMSLAATEAVKEDVKKALKVFQKK